MLPIFKLGGGGRLGAGRQPMNWVSIDDAVGAFHHALLTETIWGPVNVTTPHAVTNAEFTATLARVLSRPAIMPVPAFALRAGDRRDGGCGAQWQPRHSGAVDDLGLRLSDIPSWKPRCGTCWAELAPHGPTRR